VSYERDGQGPAVVLSHGFGPRAWGWPLERLARDCTVIAMSRFEPASPGQPYTSAIELVLAVLGHEGIDRFTLCPWSMAGPAAIAYAAGQPAALDKLVLVDVAGLGGPLMKRPHGAQPSQRRTPEEWARIRATSWVHQPGPVRDLVEALDLEGLTRTPQAFQRTMQANRQIVQSPPPIELGKIAVPTLVLAGQHSLVMGPDAAQRAAERLPDGRAVIFDESAHALPLEEPAKFQDVVAEFVIGRAASR
jgi:pimeloyl-ACP methyl ester carboxylesterase